MKKWAISAICYLLVVVGGYYTYASIAEPDKKAENHSTKSDSNEVTHQEEEGTHEEEHHEQGEDPSGDSEVQSTLQVENGELVITLKDQKGNPVFDLEVNHEKLVHLIVVSEDLKEYQHLHPQTNEPGVFKVAHSLEDGEYKAFVDIKPKDMAYEVKPISFMIGEEHGNHSNDSLLPDSNLTKEASGHQATLQPSAIKINEEIQLKFDLYGETPEQYLGALGHVVILDEKAENYIHVHPLAGNEPVFETKFTEPGIYKIWAEFKFNSEVFVFPYVVDVK
jgi:hypothetical protein